MPLSNQENGELPLINSVLPQELSSLSEKWLAESWLLSAGVVPDSSSDTLLMYAYAQRGVAKVTLEIARDEVNAGKNPKVKYVLSLAPLVYLKWKAVQKANAISNLLLRKSALLALMKAGAPIGLEDSIIALAKDYLPKNYNVEVTVNDS